MEPGMRARSLHGAWHASSEPAWSLACELGACMEPGVRVWSLACKRRAWVCCLAGLPEDKAQALAPAHRHWLPSPVAPCVALLQDALTRE